MSSFKYKIGDNVIFWVQEKDKIIKKEGKIQELYFQSVHMGDKINKLYRVDSHPFFVNEELVINKK